MSNSTFLSDLIEVIAVLLKTCIEFHEMSPENIMTTCQDTGYLIFVELVVIHLITGHVAVALNKIYRGT